MILLAHSFRRALRTSFTLALLALVAVLVVPARGASPAPAATKIAAPLAAQIARAPEGPVAVIVRGATPAADLAAAVARAGGEVTARLGLIGGVAATLPAGQVAALAADSAVASLALDAPVASSQLNWWERVDTSRLVNAYPVAIGANRLWNRNSNPLRGEGVTIAVVDSGVSPQMDLYTLMGRDRLTTSVAFDEGYGPANYDAYGHGSHVGGIIAGNGRAGNGLYIGVAPEANIINVRVLDAQGVGSTSGVIAGLQWIYENHQQYGIRVVNVSLNSLEPESYTTSALCAAVEALWLNGLVVVVSAGNQGENALYPPANDPFVITVGATDDKGTIDTADDKMAGYSAFGRTVDGLPKPDLVAPGTNIVSLRAFLDSALSVDHADNVVDMSYFRMSGTSMAAPVVAGAAALLLQSEPNLTPDQVKYRLKATARPFGTTARAGAGHVDVYAAVTNRLAGKANQGVQVSPLLNGGQQGLIWDALTQGSVNWRGKGTTFFGSVNWRGKSTGTSASDYWAP